MPCFKHPQEDEDKALGEAKEEEPEEEQGEDEAPGSESEESFDGGAFGLAQEKVKTEQDGHGRKPRKPAAVKSKPKAKAACSSKEPAKASSGRQPSSRGGEGASQKTADSAGQALKALTAVTHLQLWQAGEKLSKEHEAKISKALKLATPLEHADDAKFRDTASKLKIVCDDLVEWRSWLTSLAEHPGVKVFDVDEDLVDELVNIPCPDLSTILTDIGNQILQANWCPWFSEDICSGLRAWHPGVSSPWLLTKP